MDRDIHLTFVDACIRARRQKIKVGFALLALVSALALTACGVLEVGIETRTPGAILQTAETGTTIERSHR